jgi:uncharacterized protein YacL
VIVEAVRLCVTLAATAAGFMIGGSLTESHAIVGSVIGAGVGYVLGGALGRLFRRILDTAPAGVTPELSGPQLFGGAFGLVVGLSAGVVLAAPLVLLTPPVVAWPLAALLILLAASFSAKLGSERADDVISSFGLRPHVPMSSQRLGNRSHTFVLDTSAAIDGRVLDIARAGLAVGRMWVPVFVVDELQAIADSGDKNRRRRGRRGLQVLESLRDVAGVEISILEEEVPEHHEVDAKLIALAERAQATLVTTDANLGSAAAVRGVTVLNPQVLSEAMRPQAAAGDVIEVNVEKLGSEPGQGVGYLDDGTMVVIEQGGGYVGETVRVEVANAVRTQVGRMLFGRMAA